MTCAMQRRWREEWVRITASCATVMEGEANGVSSGADHIWKA